MRNISGEFKYWCSCYFFQKVANHFNKNIVNGDPKIKIIFKYISYQKLLEIIAKYGLQSN